MPRTSKYSRQAQQELTLWRNELNKAVSKYNRLDAKEKTYQNGYNINDLASLKYDIKSFASDIERITGKMPDRKDIPFVLTKNAY